MENFWKSLFSFYKQMATFRKYMGSDDNQVHEVFQGSLEEYLHIKYVVKVIVV